MDWSAHVSYKSTQDERPGVWPASRYEGDVAILGDSGEDEDEDEDEDDGASFGVLYNETAPSSIGTHLRAAGLRDVDFYVQCMANMGYNTWDAVRVMEMPEFGFMIGMLSMTVGDAKLLGKYWGEQRKCDLERERKCSSNGASDRDFSPVCRFSAATSGAERAPSFPRKSGPGFRPHMHGEPGMPRADLRGDFSRLTSAATATKQFVSMKTTKFIDPVVFLKAVTAAGFVTWACAASATKSAPSMYEVVAEWDGRWHRACILQKLGRIVLVRRFALFSCSGTCGADAFLDEKVGPQNL